MYATEYSTKGETETTSQHMVDAITRATALAKRRGDDKDSHASNPSKKVLVSSVTQLSAQRD